MSQPRPSTAPPRAGIRTLTTAKSLSALAHPYRSRILDALRVDGPSTASMVAARTGQAVGSASHHLKVLHEAGFVEEAPELARDRRERWWRMVGKGTRWSRDELAEDPAALAAAEEAEALAWHRQVERVTGWLANVGSDEEWSATAYATQSWARLSPDELRQVAEEITDVFARWSDRPEPDDDVEREAVYLFSRGFPCQP